MWLYTQHGHISCVKHNSKPDTIIVRARRIDHLRDILAAGKLTRYLDQIDSKTGSDYCHRVEVSRAEFEALVTLLASQVTYGNFKTAATGLSGLDSTYPRILHQVWDASAQMNDREPQREPLFR